MLVLWPVLEVYNKQCIVVYDISKLFVSFVINKFDYVSLFLPTFIVEFIKSDWI